jgi:hypothetical protein
VAAGARLCTGIDSHAVTDPFEEARAIELDERARTLSRHAALEAPALLAAASDEGYAAIGFDGAAAEDRVVLDARDPALAGAGDAALDDAVIFAATPRCVRDVHVAGTHVVRDRALPGYDAIHAGYLDALRRLGLA